MFDLRKAFTKFTNKKQSVARYGELWVDRTEKVAARLKRVPDPLRPYVRDFIERLSLIHI